jgi:hypothetical protein
MRRYFHFVFIVLIVSACTGTTRSDPGNAYMDTAVNEHLLYQKLLDEFDSTDINYGVLNAYMKKDTTYFKKLRVAIEESKRFKKEWAIQDSCIHQVAIDELKVDKAYRFIYGAAFCPYKINITVSRKGGNSILHFILYQFKWDTASCRIISDYEKQLTEKQWNEFADAIQNADFWGLKWDNGLHGVDGDNIKVWGFENGDTAFERPTKAHYVERWSVHRSTLSDPFNLLLKFTGNKQGCFWVE